MAEEQKQNPEVSPAVDPNTPPPILERPRTTKEKVKEEVWEAEAKVKARVHGFIDFIREQGVIGLAIGFILGGAVSGTVQSFVNNVINPLIGILTGKVNLNDKQVMIGAATLKYGAFISACINMIIVAAVVYFIFKGLGLDRVDKKKE